MNNISNRSSQPLIPSDAHGPAAENPENVSDNDLLLNLPISGDNRGKRAEREILQYFWN